jgi:hypothetical protein
MATRLWSADTSSSCRLAVAQRVTLSVHARSIFQRSRANSPTSSVLLPDLALIGCRNLFCANRSPCPGGEAKPQPLLCNPSLRLRMVPVRKSRPVSKCAEQPWQRQNTGNQLAPLRLALFGIVAFAAFMLPPLIRVQSAAARVLWGAAAALGALLLFVWRSAAHSGRRL